MIRSPLLWGLAIAGVILGYLFRGLTLPLFLAATVAYLLHPLVAQAEAYSIKRSVAVTGLYLAIGVVLVGAWLLLGPRVRDEAVAFAGGLPSVAERVDQALAAAAREIGQAYPAIMRFLPGQTGRQGWIDRLVEGRASSAADVFKHAGTLFILVVLVPVFAYFLLRDSARMITAVMDRLPPAHIETSVALWCEIERIIGRYLRGVALDGIAVGILASLGLWALGVPYPILLGVFAGLANVVPFVGPLLGAAAAGLVVLMHTQSLDAVGGVVLLFVGVKLVDDAVLQPLTIGRSLHLHPMLLLASVVAGNQALGILGMIVAVPAVTVLQEVARLLIEHRRTLAQAHERVSSVSTGAPRYVC